MPHYNGAGGSVTAQQVDTTVFPPEPTGDEYILPIITWEFDTSTVLDDKTAADSLGVRESRGQVSDIAGRFQIVWDSDEPPETAGLYPGATQIFIFNLNTELDFYYQLSVIIHSVSAPRVNTREGTLEYTLAFYANGPQPNPDDENDLYTLVLGGGVAEVPEQPPRPKTTLNQIEYRILHEGGGGYLENFDAEGYTSTYICLVDWDDANTWVTDMLGTHSVVGGLIQRNNPEPHLYFPGLYCVRLELLRNYGVPTAADSAQGMIAYDEVAYRASFQALPYLLSSDSEAYTNSLKELSRYVSVKQSPGVEALSRPGYGFQFYTNAGMPFVPPQYLQVPPAFLLPTMTVHLTLHFWPTANTENFQSLLGKVNNDTFTVLMRDGDELTFEAEQCLFQGWEPDFIPAAPTPTGDKTLWRHVLHIACRTGTDGSGNVITWNRVYHPTKNQFLEVKGIGDNNPAYTPADFSLLTDVS